jgi:hypothetical protein
MKTKPDRYRHPPASVLPFAFPVPRLPLSAASQSNRSRKAKKCRPQDQLPIRLRLRRFLQKRPAKIALRCHDRPTKTFVTVQNDVKTDNNNFA